MLTADREIPPRRSGCLGPDLCRGLFLGPVAPAIKKGQISFEAGLAPSSSPATLYPFPCHLFRTAVINHLTDFTGHKKDRIAFEAGLTPSSSPATLYPFPCRLFRTAVINHLTDFTGHKKDRIAFEAGLTPSSSPATLYPFPCRLFRTAVINHLTDFTGHKKDRIAFEAGLAPSSSPATLYPFPCRILTIDSKKSTLPKQRALYMVCVLADGSRIRRPSWPWPALRVPCCPRRRGQWQG